MSLKQWEFTQTLQRRTIYWVTDSENVVSFLRKGSKKPEVQAILFEVVKMASRLDINIEPIHLLREDPRIKDADEGSRRLC